MTKENKFFGKDWTKGEIKFPKHLTPEIIHTALFVSNAENMDSVQNRVEFCVKQIGDEAMSYAMALLILPTLMDMGKKQSNRHGYRNIKTSRRY